MVDPVNPAQQIQQVDLAGKVRHTFETETWSKRFWLLFITPIVVSVTIWGSTAGLRNLTGWENLPVFGFAFSLSILAYAYLFKYFLSVSVPEVTGAVTTAIFGGKMRAYPAGLHLRWPWEQKKYGNFINLRASKTDVVAENYPSGTAMLEAKFSVHYVTTWDRLPRHISVDESIINDGLLERASTKLRYLIDGLQLSEPGEQNAMAQERNALRQAKEAFGGDMLDYFKGDETRIVMADPENQDVQISVSLLDYYGIRIDAVPISDLDFEESYQKMLTAKQQAVAFKQVAMSIKGEKPDGSVSDKDARDMAFMLSGNQVKKEIKQETKVLDMSPELRELVKDVLPTAIKAWKGGQP